MGFSGRSLSLAPLSRAVMCEGIFRQFFMFANIVMCLAVVLTLYGCSDRSYKSCAELTEVAHSKSFQVKASEWIKYNIPNGTLADLKGKLNLGGGMIPGRYMVESDFDWPSIGFTGQPQIRLIVGSSNEINSVSFQERSRMSILVRMPNVEGFGFKDTWQIVNTSPGIAVFCFRHKQ